MTIDALPVLSAFHLDSLGLLEQELRIWGAEVLRLDGEQICDKESLFVRVATDFNCPDDQRPRHWDGLNDTLWQILSSRNCDKVAIVWTHAESMIEQSFNDFLLAVIVFTEAGRAAKTICRGVPQSINFRLFLVGEGAMFPRFDRIQP